jgi:hypothetical protein
MLRKMLATMLFVVIAAGAVAMSPACSRKPSDEEQIRSLFVDAAHAAEEKRVGDVVRAVADDFAGEGLDKRGVKQLVAFHLLRGSWVGVTISGDAITVEGDTARAVVDVVMVRSGKGRALTELLPEQATVHRFSLKLRRESEGWRATSGAWRPISLEEAVAGPGAPR